VTPIRFSFHHTTWHGVRCLFPCRIRAKSFGVSAAVATSSIAPVSDILRTMQIIEPPSNSMVPAFKACRALILGGYSR
jgi:hypothetical protein